MLSKIILKTRRRNKGELLNISFPCIKLLHKTLWWERMIRISIWRYLLRILYYEPLFKSVCIKFGKGLKLINGLPYTNENLNLFIGDKVTIYGDAGFQAYKVLDNPILEIGSNTYIGPQVRIGVGKKITIGEHCLIAARVYISDHDGHPMDWNKRREKMPVDKDEIKPITIEDDVWIGEGVFICKGITIGKGSIIAARSVVTKDVPQFTIAGGNPAEVIKKLDKIN